MYLNINSECKYTHIYLINNISCNFFCPGAPLARFWARQTLPAKPAEGHAPNIDCFRRGVPARRDPAFARRHAGRRALCIGCSRHAAHGPAHAVRPGRRRGDFGFLTGCDVVRTLRPAGLGRPLVYVVAWQQAEQTVLSLLECGVDQYMTFPVSLQRLRTKIANALNRQL